MHCDVHMLSRLKRERTQAEWPNGKFYSYLLQLRYCVDFQVRNVERLTNSNCTDRGVKSTVLVTLIAGTSIAKSFGPTPTPSNSKVTDLPLRQYYISETRMWIPQSLR